MPTVMFLNGWRFFFYSNENDEPPHIHCKKATKKQNSGCSSTPSILRKHSASSYPRRIGVSCARLFLGT